MEKISILYISFIVEIVTSRSKGLYFILLIGMVWVSCRIQMSKFFVWNARTHTKIHMGSIGSNWLDSQRPNTIYSATAAAEYKICCKHGWRHNWNNSLKNVRIWMWLTKNLVFILPPLFFKSNIFKSDSK